MKIAVLLCFLAPLSAFADDFSRCVDPAAVVRMLAGDMKFP